MVKAQEAKVPNHEDAQKAKDPGGLVGRSGRGSHQHFHLRRAARPRSPVQPRERAQKLLRRAAALEPGFTLPVTGAFRLDPVLALIRLRPLAVKPPFLDLQPFLMPQPFIAPFFLAAMITFWLNDRWRHFWLCSWKRTPVLACRILCEKDRLRLFHKSSVFFLQH